MEELGRRFVLTYTSSRLEIWRWYWQAWRRSLWKYHIVIFGLTFAAAMLYSSSGSIDAGTIARNAAWATAASLLTIAYPQIMFKSQQRSLEMDDTGLRTTIGKLSGERRWNEFKAVEDRADAIAIVGKNGNAFIVPNRAFANRPMRTEFLLFVQSALESPMSS